MCGITGIFSYHYASTSVKREELRLIRDQMAARGPDGKGEWFSQDGRVGLGHRRLAIIDLSDAGAQPMSNEDGSVVLVYNGEIYNYRELRAELEGQGVKFFSHSDTEVILRLYETMGDSLCSKLRGMFAFGLWDAKKNALLLARGPCGIKPLYYANDGWTFRFASQVKALLKSPAVSKDPEPAGVVGFFLLGSVPEPFTLYQEIRALPAGSFMWVDSCGPAQTQKYFNFNEAYWAGAERYRTTPVENIKEVIWQALRESVQAHLTADVPVGLFLSSGIDSTLLLALAATLSTEPMRTITLAFDEYRDTSQDEAPLAAKTAAHYGAQHSTYRLTRNEFNDDLPKVFEAMDQPTIDGINTYFISKAAKARDLKVALSGIGGDELLGGYSSFSIIPKWRKIAFIPALVPFSGEIFRGLFDAFLGPVGIFHPKFSGLLKFGGTTSGAYFLKRGLYMPWELKKFLSRDIFENGLERLNLTRRLKSSLVPSPKSDFARVSILESQWYLRNQLLRDTDWASMAHSLEVRTPYVDATLFKQLAPLFALMKPRENKAWITNSFKADLPAEVLQRKKTGFTVPMPVWLHERTNAKPLSSRQSQLWARTWARSVGQEMAV